MKKLFAVLLFAALSLTGCVKDNDRTQPTPPSGSYVVVDYQHDGGANIPTEWNNDDTAETVRKADYTVGEATFSIEFVGKWYNSTNKEELQTKKDPVSYIRSASSLVPTKVVIEVFKADMKVYTTIDMSGDEVTGTEATAVHSDGTATEYALNSANWSILAFETYKGSNINIYSLTFYF